MGRWTVSSAAGRLEHGRYHLLKAFSEQSSKVNADDGDALFTSAADVCLLGVSPGVQLPPAYRAFAGFLRRQWKDLRVGSLDAMLGGVAAGMGYTVRSVARLKLTNTVSRFTRWICPAIAHIGIRFVAPEPEPVIPARQASLIRCVTRWWWMSSS